MSHEILTLAKFDAEQIPSQMITDPHAALCALAEGKNVLNVGACGFIRDYLPDNPTQWLHHQLTEVARKSGGTLLGIDINEPAVALAKSHGYAIDVLNAETGMLKGSYDLIILMDVIEHMNAPGLAIPNLMRSLAAGGQMVITTPNAYSFAALVRNILGRSHPTFDDHIQLYAPEHFIGIARRFNLKLAELSFFTIVHDGVKGAGIRRMLYRCLLKIMPKLAQNLWVVLKPS